MPGWDYISKRRRTTLEQFVHGAKNLEEALQLFKDRGIKPPSDGRLEALYNKKAQDKLDTTAPQAPTQVVDLPPTPKTDDAVVPSVTNANVTEQPQIPSEDKPTPGYPRRKKKAKKQVEEK